MDMLQCGQLYCRSTLHLIIHLFIKKMVQQLRAPPEELGLALTFLGGS